MNKQENVNRKIRKIYTVKTNVQELSETLTELLKAMDIERLFIATYKDGIEVILTKSMPLARVEIFEKIFSLSEDDPEKIKERNRLLERYKKRTN